MESLGEKNRAVEREDFEKFKIWLGLDADSSLTDVSKRETFDFFWEKLFIGIESCIQLRELYGVVLSGLQPGPLRSWFCWLRDKHIVYLFVANDFSIVLLSEIFLLRTAEIAHILRNFFCENILGHENYFNNLFHLDFLNSKSPEISFLKIVSELRINKKIRISNEDIINSLEISKCFDWKDAIELIEGGRCYRGGRRFFSASNKFNTTFFFRLTKELLVLLVVTVSMLLLIKLGHFWYNNYLSKKFSIFIPDFLWMDQSLIFKTSSAGNKGNSRGKFQEIEELSMRKSISSIVIDEERFEAETDLFSMQEDFGQVAAASGEQKLPVRVYRDEAFGKKRVYRIIIKTDDPAKIKSEMSYLLKKYGADVMNNEAEFELTGPSGGVYYNLLIKQNLAKDFIEEGGYSNYGVVYVTRSSSTLIPDQMSRVFVWVKKI
ncbi:MAG: hypothetical protein HQK52_00010 [Oligoflexia bacterium]|nr:hypothetical protein [Oligoflexia bacterium]